MLSDGLLSAPQAAKRLNVHPSRVRVMLDRGQLRGEKLGGRWLVSDASVRERERSRPGRGRPLRPENAWAALLLASGKSPPWPAPSHGRGLPALDARGLVGLAPRLHRRAQAHRFYGHPGVLRRLAASPLLVLSGANAAAEHGLELVAGEEVDAYVAEASLARLSKQMALEPRAEGGNVLLRALPDGVEPFRERVAPIAAVALDLAEQADSRSARIGGRALARLSAERRWRSIAWD